MDSNPSSGSRFFITGTDTDVGKTVAATVLAVGLGASYWKPVQTGLAGANGDAAFVAKWIGQERVVPGAYAFPEALSPHAAATMAGVQIDVDAILACTRDLPAPLITEGAGGVLVPLNNQYLMIDLLRALAMKTIVVSHTRLGCINHTLLTLEALRQRQVQIHGVLFVGDENAISACAIAEYGRAPLLGRIPMCSSFSLQWFQNSYANLVNINGETSSCI